MAECSAIVARVRVSIVTKSFNQTSMGGSIQLVAVGDLQLGDSPTTVGYGFYSRYGRACLTPLFDRTRASLSGADVLFGNLETTLSPPPAGSADRGELQLRGQPSFAEDLRAVGFTILNVANNHAVQHGDASFHTTVSILRAAGISCCGVRGSAPWASEPVSMTVRGERIGVLGYCLRPRQYGSAQPPYAEGTAEQICADVARLRAISDVVLVSLHWGEEFVPVPSDDEVSLGHSIIDAGAAVIIGHHPHVTRLAEQYNDGVIAYSLGNFMGDMVWFPPFRRGAVLRSTISDGRVIDASMLATTLGDDYAPSRDSEPAATPVRTKDLVSLNAPAYQAAIADSMRRQRAAAYRSAVQNVLRIPPRILSQMLAQTVRNKLAAVWSRP